LPTWRTSSPQEYARLAVLILRGKPKAAPKVDDDQLALFLETA